MRKLMIGAALAAVLLISPAAVLAQQPATRTEEVSASFTIEAIDHTTRVVTLRNKAGLLEEVYAGPEVQRFDALRVGDVVTFRYFETVVTALSRPGAAATPSTTVTRTPGAAPGGTIARQTTATVTLEAINPNPPTPSVTVRTASGGRSTFRVQDAKNLEGYKVGDQVTITYTRGLAVSVAAPVPAEQKPRMEIYGFAMLDMGLNFKTINPNWFDTMRVNRLPSFDDEFGEDGSTFAGVRQTPPGRQGLQPHAARRAADDVRVRNVRHGRRRGPDDVPPAARLRRARPGRRRASTGARSWTSTCSRTRSSTGGPPAWCSSATSRCGGCRSRATRA